MLDDDVNGAKVTDPTGKVCLFVLDEYWTCSHPQILCTSLDLGGAGIIFSQNWNFGLKFFLVNPLIQKIGSTWFLDPKKPKNDSETAKNCQSVDTVTHLEQ